MEAASYKRRDSCGWVFLYGIGIPDCLISSTSRPCEFVRQIQQSPICISQLQFDLSNITLLGRPTSTYLLVAIVPSRVKSIKPCHLSLLILLDRSMQMSVSCLDRKGVEDTSPDLRLSSGR